MSKQVSWSIVLRNLQILVILQDLSVAKTLGRGRLSLWDFSLYDSSLVFVASDALSHYIIMMYELSKCQYYCEELAEEYLKQSGNSQLLKTAETLRFNFKNDVIYKLLQVSDCQFAFEEYLKGLYHQGVIDMDDFTICWIYKQL